MPGNHDYGSNPDAQIAYSKISRRWRMPARYYSKKFAINGDTTNQVLIAFIDTNPLIPGYYKDGDYGPNAKSQDTTAQKIWLEKLLQQNAANPNVKWKLVVGHHPHVYRQRQTTQQSRYTLLYAVRSSRLSISIRSMHISQGMSAAFSIYCLLRGAHITSCRVQLQKRRR